MGFEGALDQYVALQLPMFGDTMDRPQWLELLVSLVLLAWSVGSAPPHTWGVVDKWDSHNDSE
jgi:hypothetical protein